MQTLQLKLTHEERDLLARILEEAWKETRVEVHHAHFSPDFREGVKRDESMLAELLEKVREC